MNDDRFEHRDVPPDFDHDFDPEFDALAERTWGPLQPQPGGLHRRLAQPVERRAFLRGLGTALALPALASLTPRGARADEAPATNPDGPPLRIAFLYVPNGVHMPDWTPASEGRDFELPPTLAPLASVRDKLTVLSGLTHDKARANGDGPGDHARSSAAVLTGCQPRKTDGADIHVGISVDQWIAQQRGEATTFPSLELGVDRSAQAGNCDSGYSCAYSSNIAWSSPSSPVAKEINPRLVFERLFGNGNTQEMGQAEVQRQAQRRSILDFVLDDARQLQSRLGGRDKAKLDEYLTSVRDIERRLARAELGEAADLPGAEKPAGIPGAYDEHTALMLDMLVLAFQADQTRVATFMFANEGSNRAYREIGVDEGHHELSHHQGDAHKQARIASINRLHTTLLAGFLERLNGIQEADGQSLLDHSLIVYCSAISDGNVHNHDELPVLLAGGGGGVNSGRHLRFSKDTPMCNLYLSLLGSLGLTQDTFGDSTGYLNGLQTA